MSASALKEKIESTLRELGSTEDLLSRRDLPLFADASELALAHVSASGRQHFLIPAAAAEWVRMRDAAARDAVVLTMISGFRGFDRQLQLIREKLARGQQLDQILRVMAPPGCSEHHSGRAVDIGTPGCAPLSETFEATGAFSWLAVNAGRFGFRLSYPRGNPFGYEYEPWHWCYAGS